ncbi:MAG: radical SAM protein, partial [Candidatus Diapherotrites archaeon]
LELLRSLESGRNVSRIKGLCRKEGGKIKKNRPRRAFDPNNLPLLDFGLVDAKKYVQGGGINIMTSFGCPNSCAFCYNLEFWNCRWRLMSAERALEEISAAVDLLGLERITIMDDNFFPDLKRAMRIAEGIERLGVSWEVLGACVSDISRMGNNYLSGLAETGCTGFVVGVESGSDKILKSVGKRHSAKQALSSNLALKKAGIRPTYSFMSGFPGESMEDLRKTVGLFLKLKKDYPEAVAGNIKPLIVYPGTGIYGKALGLGLKPPETLEGWAEWSWGNYASLDIPWLSQERKQLLADLYYATLLMSPDFMFVKSGLFKASATILSGHMRKKVEKMDFRHSYITRIHAMIQKYLM